MSAIKILDEIISSVADGALGQAMDLSYSMGEESEDYSSIRALVDELNEIVGMLRVLKIVLENDKNLDQSRKALFAINPRPPGKFDNEVENENI